jgi:hypothetical protein
MFQYGLFEEAHDNVIFVSSILILIWMKDAYENTQT